jgi:undecaprenyl-diphosphatase
MTWWQAIILGVVQGLTEFLPVSSTAHLIVVQQWFGLPADGPFTTVVQMGTLVAVFIYFRSDLWRVANAVLSDLKQFHIGTTPDSRLAWLMVVGSIPAGLVGAAFGSKIKALFYDPLSIGVVSITFALLMLAAEIWHRTRKQDRHLPELVDADLTWKEALWVGLWQTCALLPGASRSGCTISGALFAGLNRTTAARFSFLLSLPVMLAACGKDLYDATKQPGEHRAAVAWQANPPADVPPEQERKHQKALRDGPGLFASGDQVVTLAVATVVSGVVGYAAVAWLISFLKRASMTVFVGYRILLGVVLIALSLAGALGTNSGPTPSGSRATVVTTPPPP